jgi:hypothetical protein
MEVYRNARCGATVRDHMAGTCYVVVHEVVRPLVSARRVPRGTRDPIDGSERSKTASVDHHPDFGTMRSRVQVSTSTSHTRVPDQFLSSDEISSGLGPNFAKPNGVAAKRLR